MTSELSIVNSDVVTKSSSIIDQSLLTNNCIEIECIKSENLELFDKDLLFNETNDTFSILQKNEFKLEQVNKKSLNLRLDGFVHKIILLDFPNNGNYILSFNGNNVCSTMPESIDGKIYDVFNISRSQSNQLKSYMFFCNHNIHYHSINSCINMDRIDNVCINHSKFIKFNYIHKISVHSYVFIDNMVINKITNYEIYPFNTFSLSLNHPTYGIQLDVYEKLKLMVEINGNKIFETYIESGSNMIVFRNKGIMFHGAQNSYLNDKQNHHSINMSRIDNVSFILLNSDNKVVENFKTYQYFYKCYYKKLIGSKFAD